MKVKRSLAITTKYMGPTNTKGARIKASVVGGTESFTLSYEHDQDAYNNSALAMALLVQKLVTLGRFGACGLAPRWPDVATVSPTGNGYTFHLPTE